MAGIPRAVCMYPGCSPSTMITVSYSRMGLLAASRISSMVRTVSGVNWPMLWHAQAWQGRYTGYGWSMGVEPPRLHPGGPPDQGH